MRKKLFALPWCALTRDAVEKRFILDASKEKLENAEGWDEEYARKDLRPSTDSTYATDRTDKPATIRI
jgi:hypothetical protein